MNFKGKKILVTGATGGIGGDIVKNFLSLNATVVRNWNKFRKIKFFKDKYPNLIN